MIVYNVERCWFPMKNDAEAYRRQLGLKPDANFKLVIETREELAALLNGLMGLKPEPAAEAEAEPPPPAGAVLEPAPAPKEVVERNVIEVPSYVPKFLAEAWAKHGNRKIRWVEGEK